MNLSQSITLSETKSTIEDVKNMLAKKPTRKAVKDAHNILESLLDDLSYEGNQS